MQSNQTITSTPYMHRCGHVYARFIEAQPPKSRMMICDKCLEPMPICDDRRNAYRYELHIPKTLSVRERPAPEPMQAELDIWTSALIGGGHPKSLASAGR